MRILYIGCLTLIGIFFCFTDLHFTSNGVFIDRINAPYLGGFIWNLATLTIGVFTGSALMGHLVEGYYKYYDLYTTSKSSLIDARDRLKKLEDKYIALGLQRDELRLDKHNHSDKLKRLEDVRDMIRAIDIQYGGRNQKTVDLTQHREIKEQLWKEVFNYGK